MKREVCDDNSEKGREREKELQKKDGEFFKHE